MEYLSEILAAYVRETTPFRYQKQRLSEITTRMPIIPIKAHKVFSQIAQSANRKTYQLPPMKTDKERGRGN